MTLLLPEEERVAAELGKHPEAGTQHGVAASHLVHRYLLMEEQWENLGYIVCSDFVILPCLSQDFNPGLGKNN